MTCMTAGGSDQFTVYLHLFFNGIVGRLHISADSFSVNLMSAFQISSFFDQQFPCIKIRVRNDLIHFTLIMCSVVLLAGF